MPESPDIALASYLLRSVIRDAVDGGALNDAGMFLAQAKLGIPEDDDSSDSKTARLNSLIWESAILQHRGRLEDAEQVAATSVAHAEGLFSFGIHVARAQTRFWHTRELRGDYAAAGSAMFELEGKLRAIPGAEVAGLNALTRALACAIKAEDGEGQWLAAELSSRVSRTLNPQSVARNALRWSYCWLAIGMIKLSAARPARDLLQKADRAAFPSWRWGVIRQVAGGHLLRAESREKEARVELDEARRDATARGYLGLLRFFDDVFDILDK